MSARCLHRLAVVAVAACGTAGCGGSDHPVVTAGPGARSADEAAFGPLEVGANYRSFRKVSAEPFLSLDHGNRWVEVWVNEVGAQAYVDETEIPVGTIVVKTSWVTVNKRRTDVAGPIFVMEKRAPGYAPEHGDWWFAIHWANPPAADARKYGGPVYWRGRSHKVDYCWECHDNYDRGLGGLVPSSLLPR